MCIGRLLPEPINLFSSIQESENSKDSYSLHSHAYPILCLICELLVSLKSMNKDLNTGMGFSSEALVISFYGYCIDVL